MPSVPSRSPSRRQALVAGAGFAGLTLAGLLRAEAGAGRSVKSVINVHLDGGPPQHETIDPKPDAPEEVRGEFRPIATSVPGLRVSELMPNPEQDHAARPHHLLDRAEPIRELL
jgi:hypothetical protein